MVVAFNPTANINLDIHHKFTDASYRLLVSYANVPAKGCTGECEAVYAVEELIGHA